MTDRLTDEEIAAGLAACEKATRGPWEVETLDGYITGHVRSTYHNYAGNAVSRRDSVTAPDSMTAKDAKFIALARTLLPRALAELSEMRANAEKAR